MKIIKIALFSALIPAISAASYSIIDAQPRAVRQIQFPGFVSAISTCATGSMSSATIALVRYEPGIGYFTNVIAGPTLSPATTNILLQKKIPAFPSDRIVFYGIDATNGTLRANILVEQ